MAKEYALLYPRPGSTFEAVIGRPFYPILKEARERKGIGVRELSRSAGCSHSYLMLIENGKRTPAPKLLSNLQKALGVEPFFLVPREELESVGDFDLQAEIEPQDDQHDTASILRLLVAALLRGGCVPRLSAPDEQEEKSGVISKIKLEATPRFEIVVKATK